MFKTIYTYYYLIARLIWSLLAFQYYTTGSADRGKMLHLIFWTIIILPSLSAQSIYAQGKSLQLKAGFAGVEASDDIVRPAATIRFEMPRLYVHSFVWGREFGPFKEQSLALSVGRRYMVFDRVNISAQLGLSVLVERQELSPSDGSGSKTEVNTNAGMDFGLNYLKEFSWFSLEVFWQSHLYPAGARGGPLLATGRHEFIGIALGVVF